MTSPETYPDHPDPAMLPEFYSGVSIKRFFAWIVDSFIISLLTFIAGLLTLSVAFWFWPLAYLLLGFFYRVYTLSDGSATWGMRLLGIEFRNRQGDRFNSGDAFVHTLGYSVCLAFGILQMLNILLMLFTAKGQALHDLVVGSVAINATR